MKYPNCVLYYWFFTYGLRLVENQEDRSNRSELCLLCFWMHSVGIWPVGSNKFAGDIDGN